MACYIGWHNYKKRYLIKAPATENQSHGEEAGIPRATIERSRRKMFRERAFLSLIKLDRVEMRIWQKSVPPPGTNNPAYLPAFAFG
jgi:hypothetical protein